MKEATAMVLAALSVPVVVELRVVLAFFGIQIPLWWMLGVQVAVLAAIGETYRRSQHDEEG